MSDANKAAMRDKMLTEFAATFKEVAASHVSAMEAFSDAQDAVLKATRAIGAAVSDRHAEKISEGDCLQQILTAVSAMLSDMQKAQEKVRHVPNANA